jgi:TRAP-type C4-dicarboxylate transport system substrate-binding protein
MRRLSCALLGLTALGLLPVTDAQAQAPRVLRLNSSFAPQGYIADAMNFFAAEVQKRSEGRLKIEVYFNSSLGFKNTVILSSMKKGLVDLSEWMGGNIDGELPIAGVLNLPFLHADYDKGIRWQIERLTPEMNAITNKRWDVTILAAVALPAPTEFFSNAPLKSLKDLQDVKIRSWGGMLGDSLYYIGAKPYTITTSELYTALQRGMVSASITSVISATETRFWEVLKYVDHITLTTNQNTLGIRNEVLKKLPPDLQKVMIDSGKALTQWGLDNYKPYAKSLLKILTDNGMQEVWPEPGEIEKMREKCKPLYDKFVKEMSPESLPLLKELGVY